MKKQYLVAMIGLALAGCGGSGSSSNGDSTVTPPTIPQTQFDLVSGTIQDADNGIVTINGKDYRVDSVTYSEQTLPTTVLVKGIAVELKKSSSTPQQFTAKLEPTFAGKVEFVDTQTGQFTINGVRLQFDALHKEIENGDWVMVYAKPSKDKDGKDSYKVVSVVEFETTDEDYKDLADLNEIEGVITNIDLNASTFSIGGVVVAHTGSNELPIDRLETGRWVEVDGQMQGDTFVATKVDLEDYDDFYHDDHENEIEGVITWVSKGASSFVLNHSLSISVDTDTDYISEQGKEANQGDLKKGREVDVVVRMSGDRLVAKLVEFDHEDSDDDSWTTGSKHVEFECDNTFVTDTDPLDNKFEIGSCDFDDDPFVKPIGNEILFDSLTIFEGVKKSQLDGKRLDIEGIITVDGKNIAREIELAD